MQENCLACASRITQSLYNPGPQPLAALNLPRSRDAARLSLRFPMNMRVCGMCGHVFNAEFDYYKVPYEDNSNLMFNRGHLWLKHMDGLVDSLVRNYGVTGQTLVDIGCGDGLFFKMLIDRKLNCRCIGFEPGIEAENARKNGLLVFKDYFHPERDLKLLPPDVLVCRHVIEHLANPRDFVGNIAYWCNQYELFPLFVAEVPRIDKAVEQGRVTDFLYEHVSNFTDRSFRLMFETCGYDVLEAQPCYDDEVIVLVARARRMAHLQEVRRSSEAFQLRTEAQYRQVTGLVHHLVAEGKQIAFWGGTGKGAAFLNTFGFAEEQFSIVVDSDMNKVGRFVPGMAQEIRSPDYLREHPVDVIVITTRWRAKDIYHEILARQIAFQQILVFEGAELKPYRDESLRAAA